MSQQKMITSFISTANVQKVSANVSKSISSENVEPSKDVVFDDRPPNVKLNPAKRFHSCLSSDSDHSLCIENIGSGNKACNHLLLRHVNVFKSIISRR
jgi:hypothetical protein